MADAVEASQVPLGQRAEIARDFLVGLRQGFPGTVVEIPDINAGDAVAALS